MGREVTGRDAGRLRPAAVYDLARHHGPEAIFVGPASAACPAAVRDPVFREPTAEETARPRQAPGGTPAVRHRLRGGRRRPRPGLLPDRRRPAGEPPGTRVRAPARRHPPAPAPAPGPSDWPGVPLPTD